jgi:hypothetical protein
VAADVGIGQGFDGRVLGVEEGGGFGFHISGVVFGFPERRMTNADVFFAAFLGISRYIFDIPLLFDKSGRVWE